MNVPVLPMPKRAVDQDLLPEVNSFIQPLERLFGFLEGRGLVVLHRKVVDFKAIAPLDLMKVAVLTAEVYDTVNPLIANRFEFFVGHGRMTHGQLISNPVKGVCRHGGLLLNPVVAL